MFARMSFPRAASARLKVPRSFVVHRCLTVDSNKTRKSNVYTRTGDSGERKSKTDSVFHALGNQDELNAAIGVACEYCKISNNQLEDQLIEIQSRLFDLGAAVATPIDSEKDNKILYTKFSKEHTAQLEKWIDKLDSQLPPLKNFILPGGGLSAAHLHFARTVCRRAERSVVHLVNDGKVDPECGKYLNRLSDYLFVAARTATIREKKEEVVWRKLTSPQQQS